MHKAILFFILIGLSGCAITQEYKPLESAVKGTFELNKKALSQVKLGMTQEQVHEIMGESITIGYNYSQSKSDGPLPITLQNPYKITSQQESRGRCTIEYYAMAVLVPDGQVSDDELFPLKFCESSLVAMGWDKVK